MQAEDKLQDASSRRHKIQIELLEEQLKEAKHCTGKYKVMMDEQLQHHSRELKD